MEKYQFLSTTSSEYKADPLFHYQNFSLFCDQSMGCSGPLIFYAGPYNYLISERKLLQNKEFTFKAACYIYYNWESNPDNPMIFFIGSTNDCNEIAKEFSNQIIRIVSPEMIEDWYPKTPSQIARLFVNFFFDKQTHFGQLFSEGDFDLRFLTFSPHYLQEDEIHENQKFVMHFLIDNDFIEEKVSLDGPSHFLLTEKGIEFADKNKDIPESKEAFIAIKFGENIDRIQAIQKAIADCGFKPLIMSEYQTNNWIMPELFHQIKQCRFVVADFSLPCDGAYYEAGYALALGKEVIHLYDLREKEKSPLHFDVAQKSTIMYENYDELTKKLFDRIKATIQ
jgi:nucleoside 2-deoxyribosyltransferase